jgi:hypothetical protein
MLENFAKKKVSSHLNGFSDCTIVTTNLHEHLQAFMCVSHEIYNREKFVELSCTKDPEVQRNAFATRILS